MRIGRKCRAFFRRNTSSSFSSGGLLLESRDVPHVSTVFNVQRAGMSKLARQRHATDLTSWFLAGRASEADPLDPGRVSLMGEYWHSSGERVFGCPSRAGNGYVMVTKHNASEQDSANRWPSAQHGAGPWRQEWRQLRFLESETSPTEIVQSIVKVWVSHVGYPVVIRSEVLALGYTKTCASIVLSAAHACGAVVAKDKPLRALVVGLGAGAIPQWLTNRFTNLICDSIEVDASVVGAAVEALGFPASALRPTAGAVEAALDAIDPTNLSALRTYICSGQDFVAALLQHAPRFYVYDLVIIDAFDQKGAVPEPLIDKDGVFLQGLGRLLSPCAAVSMNVLNSSGTPEEISKMARNVADVTQGDAFFVKTPAGESSNICFGFTTARIKRISDGTSALQVRLEQSARRVGDAIGANFSLSRRVGVKLVEL